MIVLCVEYTAVKVLTTHGTPSVEDSLLRHCFGFTVFMDDFRAFPWGPKDVVGLKVRLDYNYVPAVLSTTFPSQYSKIFNRWSMSLASLISDMISFFSSLMCGTNRSTFSTV